MGKGGQNSGRMELMRELGVHVDFTTKEWKATGLLPARIKTEQGEERDVVVKILTNKEQAKDNLPAFSNSPDSVYAKVDKNGNINQIRIYENYRTVVDIDIDKSSGPHWHSYQTEGIPPQKMDSKIEKNSEHNAITPSEHQRYGEMLGWLGKKPSEIQGYQGVE